MKEEFKRFGLAKFPELIGVVEIAGGIGLLIGLYIPFFLVLSTGGLTFLMFMALFFRMKAGDTFWQSSPATVFMVLTGYLFVVAVNLW